MHSSLGCSLGDVKIVGTEVQGLLQRCDGSGQWTQMCGYMNQQNAQVICRQLGLSSRGM